MSQQEMVKKQAAEMVQRVLNESFAKKTFDIRYDYNEQEEWSVITIHTKEDNEISVRMYGPEEYALYYGYYDEEDEFHEVLLVLPEEIKATIPKPLHNAMEKVLHEESGIKLPGNFMNK
jgi:hypothetical protein